MMNSSGEISPGLCKECELASLDHSMPQGLDEIMNILRSGRAPSSVIERLDLTQKLQAVQEDIDRCQRELDGPQNAVKAVEMQKSKQLFSSHRDRIHSIIASPIRQLPSEMLLEIFSDLCATPEANYISDLPILQTVVLSQVCIRWYNLVHDTPALWSKFTITRGYGTPLTALVALFLERSCTHPIDFDLYPISCQSEIAALITTSAVSDRWNRVQFLNIDYPLGQRLLQSPVDPVNHSMSIPIPARTFPKLVSLRLQTSSDDVVYPMPHCPNLHSLTLQKVCLYRHHASSLHWTGVQRLQLDNLTSSQAFHILESCPNAEDVSLGWIQPNFSQSLPHLICSHIRKLKLTYDLKEVGVVGPLAVLLNTLNIPTLTHLILGACSHHRSSASEGCSSLLESISSMLNCSLIGVSSVGGNYRVCTSVTHLCLDSPVGFSDLEIRGLFGALPCITQLEYIEPQRDGQRITKTVIQCLIAPRAHFGDSLNNNSDGLKKDGDYNKEYYSSQDCLLPNLQSLILDLCPPDDLLIQLIRSRWRLQESHSVDSQFQFVLHAKPVCLGRVDLWVRSFDSTMVEYLRRKCQLFCDEGLVVDIH